MSSAEGPDAKHTATLSTGDAVVLSASSSEQARAKAAGQQGGAGAGGRHCRNPTVADPLAFPLFVQPSWWR